MKKFTILIPVYNDWTSAFILLKSIDAQVANWDAEVSVLIINDASSDNRPKKEIIFKNIKSVKVINMKNNKGHARCIAAGMKFSSPQYHAVAIARV